MSGVEILAAEEVVTELTSNWWIAGVLWLAIVIIAGIVGFCESDDLTRCAGTMIGCLAGVVIGVLPWMLAAAITSTPVSYETHYKVTIDNSVSMNEFLDKYEIIDQDGKIYTVRERK